MKGITSLTVHLSYRDKIRTLARKNKRTVMGETELALDKHLESQKFLAQNVPGAQDARKTEEAFDPGK